MLKHCQKSCNICKVMQAMGMDPTAIQDDSLPIFRCLDISTDCETKAMNGECELNPDYMNIKVYTQFITYLLNTNCVKITSLVNKIISAKDTFNLIVRKVLWSL